MSQLPTFAEFFRALWGKDPFPWQEMLAERSVAGRWPDAVDLPTACGKTACLDIAVYALAAQSTKAMHERTSARRIWFVVDRRIVVDEAFERAEQLAEKLADKNAASAIRAVAERLLDLRGLPPVNARWRSVVCGAASYAMTAGRAFRRRLASLPALWTNLAPDCFFAVTATARSRHLSTPG